MGKTDRRSIERIINHNKLNKKPHPLKHVNEENHTHMWEQDLRILGSKFNNQVQKEKSVSRYL